MIALLTLAVAAALARPASPPSTPAAGLRIDGTFIQLNGANARWTSARWAAELEAVRRCGLRTLIIQWIEYNGVRFTPTRLGAPDPTGAIMSYADRHGMTVWVGLAADDAWWKRFTAPEYLARSTADCERTARDAWRRYGRRRSFGGWYLPNEAWDAPFTPDQTTRLRGFYRRLSDLCKGLSRRLPVATAPFFSGLTPPEMVRRNYSAILDGAGIDVVMLQDGVGARRWDDDVEGRVRPYFAAFREACAAAGVELWSDLEVFRIGPGVRGEWGPAPAERVARQMAAEAPYVRRFVMFEFPTYMNPARGPAARALREGYLERHVRRAFRPLFGPSVQIDPGFAYYRDRSVRSIADEIRANGYPTVHYVVTNDRVVNRDLVRAFQSRGVGVWYMTFGNGGYGTAAYPPGWEAWKMVTRSDLAGVPLNDGYTRLCLNNPDYRAWKKQSMSRVIRENGFDGIEFAEPHWPEYPGIESPAYGCFCARCRADFVRMFPGEGELPDIIHPESPLHPSRNGALWDRWLRFRKASLTAFLNDLVNGPGGIRETSPRVRVCTWTLALSEPDGVRKVREIHGEDAVDVVRIVRPDAHMLQTHWPDWVRGDLSPDYVAGYRAFIDPIRRAAPSVPVLIQADIGSLKPNRRAWDWVRAFEAAARRAGASGSTLYEYFIGGFMYSDPPHVVEVERTARGVRLLFSKRLDPRTAGDSTRYALDGGMVTGVEVDGASVLVRVDGPRRDARMALTLRGIGDAVDRRLFDDRPRRVLEEQTVRFIW